MRFTTRIMKWAILVIGFGVLDADSYFKSVTDLDSCDCLSTRFIS